jgi:hypothetical protein
MRILEDEEEEEEGEDDDDGRVNVVASCKKKWNACLDLFEFVRKKWRARANVERALKAKEASLLLSQFQIPIILSSVRLQRWKYANLSRASLRGLLIRRK